MNPIETNYWKVDISYLQKSQLLVVAKSAEEAKEMVQANVAEGTEQFVIGDAVELTDDEKEWVLKNMQGLTEEEPSGEVQDVRTLN